MEDTEEFSFSREDSEEESEVHGVRVGFDSRGVALGSLMSCLTVILEVFVCVCCFGMVFLWHVWCCFV